MHRRRAEPRKMQICRISALWRDEYGFSRALAGLLEDRSRSGVGIALPEPIAVGTKVRIRGRLHELTGTVRSCRVRGAEYLVGIQLERKDATWDRFGVGL
jgi:hypothetical protein